MAGVYSHNRASDDGRWAGEAELDALEKLVITDGVVDVSPTEVYEEALGTFWASFIEDSSMM